MKINGRKLEQVYRDTLVLPRGNDEIIVLHMKTADMKKFRELVKEPIPPNKTIPRKGTIVDVDDPGYKKKLAEYNMQMHAWLIVDGIEEGVEWEFVDKEKPVTWTKCHEELEQSGLTDFERARVYQSIMSMNVLDEDKIEKARQDFFHMHQENQNTITSLKVDPNST